MVHVHVRHQHEADVRRVEPARVAVPRGLLLVYLDPAVVEGQQPLKFSGSIATDGWRPVSIRIARLGCSTRKAGTGRRMNVDRSTSNPNA